MKNILIGCLLLFTLFLPMQLWAYTNPGNPTGYVNDFAGILSTETHQQLETKLSELDASTSAQVSVVTIKSMGNDTIENFAEKLFQDWGIGQKGKDNGALLLVALEDKKVKIEVGYGLEGALTDAQSSSIIRNTITPAFKQGNYETGISEGVDKIVQAIRGETVVSDDAYVTTDNSEVMSWIMGLMFFGIPGLLWFISIISRSKSWWAGGVVGAILGAILWDTSGLLVMGLIGLLLDFIVSKEYKKSTNSGAYPWWIGGKNGFGSGGSSSSRGGFGGFGGGRSGGGGASGGW